MPNEEPPAGRGWLGPLRRLLPGGRGGDTIRGSVGAGASDVAIGKNIIQVGTLIIPVLPAVVVLLLVLAGGVVAAWYLLVPSKMSGTFNVAVADFSEEDATGKVGASENGRMLSRLIYENLADELKDLPRAMQPVEVWHDSLGLTRKRAIIGFVPGQTPAERRTRACKLADAIGADVIIYGNLDATHRPANFVPEFCIHAPPSDTGELDQITGDYQLGSPIPVTLPFDLRSRSFVNGRLAARAGAMSWLTVGVIYDLNGSPQAALDAFQKAMAVFQDDGSGSPDEPGDGKEVIWYFIGREDLFLKRLPDSTAAFREAIAQNPTYARGHLGLGGVFFTRAQAVAPADRLQTDDLASAIAEYALAVSGARQAQDPRAEFQAHLALGSAYRLRGETHLFRGEYDPANGEFDAAIAEVQAGVRLIDADQYRSLAYADLILGTAYHQKAHIRLVQGDKATSKDWFEQAHRYYQQCIQTADLDPQDVFLAKRIKATSCEPFDQAVVQALADLGAGHS